MWLGLPLSMAPSGYLRFLVGDWGLQAQAFWCTGSKLATWICPQALQGYKVPQILQESFSFWEMGIKITLWDEQVIEGYWDLPWEMELPVICSVDKRGSYLFCVSCLSSLRVVPALCLGFSQFSAFLFKFMLVCFSLLSKPLSLFSMSACIYCV